MLPAKLTTMFNIDREMNNNCSDKNEECRSDAFMAACLTQASKRAMSGNKETSVHKFNDINSNCVPKEATGEIGNVASDEKSNQEGENSKANLAQEIEDWHLLEMEDQAPEPGSPANGNLSLTRTVESKSKTGIRRKYVEINPLHLDGPYKSVLIYLCTAVYSLLPIASVLATFTLIALLFTRFFYVPLLYFAYIFCDRNTCNRGKFVEVISHRTLQSLTN